MLVYLNIYKITRHSSFCNRVCRPEKGGGNEKNKQVEARNEVNANMVLKGVNMKLNPWTKLL